MIVLWLLAAHLVGDYLLQTRWQAVGKFGWSDEAYWLRTRHVLAYTATFVPVAVIYGWGTGASQGSGTLAFLALLAIVHFLTDAQRFVRTPGEWLLWRLMRRDTQLRHQQAWLQTKIPMRDTGGSLLMPPNPWPPIGLAIDQTLHLVQIAALATIFLTS